MTQTKAYRVKGSTQDVTECGLCGRSDLRGTVVLAVLDADGNETENVYYGSDCGARAAGWTQRDMTKRVRTADREVAELARRERNAQREAERLAYNAWLAERYGVSQPAELHAKGLRPLEIHRQYRAETGA